MQGFWRGALLGATLAFLWYFEDISKATTEYVQQFRRPLSKLEQEVKELLDKPEA